MSANCRVLLTGSGGFIGSSMLRLLEESKIEVTALKRTDADLTSISSTKLQHKFGIFDVVMHFASSGVRAKKHDPSTITDEIKMVTALFPLLREGGRFLYAGSVSEYGRSGVLSEKDKCTPQTWYGKAKHEASQWLLANSKERGVSPRIARIFGAYGHGEGPYRLLPYCVERLSQGREVQLSDGEQIRDFIHVSDVANICMKFALSHHGPNILNVGTGVGTRVAEVIGALCAEIEADKRLLKFGARDRSIHDFDVQVANVSELSLFLDSNLPQPIMAKASILNTLTVR